MNGAASAVLPHRITTDIRNRHQLHTYEKPNRRKMGIRSVGEASARDAGAPDCADCGDWATTDFDGLPSRNHRRLLVNCNPYLRREAVV
jgi:hypothetical protein